MSLLAEALKKSQKQDGFSKEKGPTGTVPPSSPAPDASSRKPFPMSIGQVTALCAVISMLLYIGLTLLNEKADSARPAASLPGALPANAPRLEGIVWDEQSPLALLNGKPRKTGDVVDGWTLKAISPDRVTLNSGGENIALSLAEAPAS